MSEQSTDATELARRHTPKAIGVLADIIENRELHETRDVIRAAESLLDRAHGKPTQAVIVAHTERRKALKFASMSDAELMEAIDGDYTPLALPSPASVESDPLLG